MVKRAIMNRTSDFGELPIDSKDFEDHTTTRTE